MPVDHEMPRRASAGEIPARQRPTLRFPMTPRMRALLTVMTATLGVAGDSSAAPVPPLLMPDRAPTPSPEASAQTSITRRSMELVPATATDQHGMTFTMSGMSGITWQSGDAADSIFAIVLDNSDKIVRLRVGFNHDGSISSLAIVDGLTLAASGDHEGIAFTDAATNSTFVSNEVGPAIDEFDLSTGALIRTLAVPSVFTEPANLRSNCGLESLSRCPDTGDLWTANEEALTVDGPRSTPTNGTLVRLTSYSQGPTPDAPTPHRQHAYLTEPLHGTTMKGARSGVSDIVAISRGRLLILERSFASGEGLFKNSIYLVDPAEGSPTDTTSLAALDGVAFTPVKKRLLWSAYLNQNLEGLCVGPQLSPTSRVLLGVVDDADPISMNAVISFELIDPPHSPHSADAAAEDNATAEIIATPR